MEKIVTKQISWQNSTVNLNVREFNRLSKFIVDRFGIKMPLSKKSMLQGRLQKRLRALHMKDFKEYIDFLFSGEGHKNELSKMIEEVSTNKTDFFREPVHFDFLYSDKFEHYIKTMGNKKLSVWSAGCSSGEEPYSIAITLNEYKLLRHNIEYQIIATDISQKIVEQAKNGIFSIEKASVISTMLQKKYLLKGKNSSINKIKIKDFIKDKIAFQLFNLLSSNYHAIGKQDVIFCRNVLIYFDRELQYAVLNRLCKQLNPGGFLFLGHTESIIGFSLPLIQLKPSIYMKNK